MLGKIERILLIAGAARSIAGAVTAPSATEPLRPVRMSVISCSACSNCRSTERAWRASERPSGVKRTPRDSRSQSCASSSDLHLGDHARGGRLRNVHRVGRRADHLVLLERDNHAQMRDLEAAAGQGLAGPGRRDRDFKGLQRSDVLVHFTGPFVVAEPIYNKILWIATRNAFDCHIDIKQT